MGVDRVDQDPGEPVPELVHELVRRADRELEDGSAETPKLDEQRAPLRQEAGERHHIAAAAAVAAAAAAVCPREGERWRLGARRDAEPVVRTALARVTYIHMGSRGEAAVGEPKAPRSVRRRAGDGGGRLSGGAASVATVGAAAAREPRQHQQQEGLETRERERAHHRVIEMLK